MKSFLKFLVFVLLLALGISLIYVWEAKQPGQAQVKIEKFTPADRPSLDLSSVDVLQRLDEEYTKVTAAVVPSVVSITTTRTVTRRMPMDPLELFFRPPFFGSQSCAAEGHFTGLWGNRFQRRAHRDEQPCSEWNQRCDRPAE